MSSAEKPENTENTEKIEKTKRVLTETQLQVLKLAREKAMEKRKFWEMLNEKRNN